MTEVIHTEGGSDSSATGIIAGILIVLVIVGAIWFFGFRGKASAPADNGGANINVTLPANNQGSTGGTGSSGY